MATETKISILMPAYNAEKFIRRSIDSIISQTYLNWELLIADDASNDATKSIIDSYTDGRIKRYHNSQNLGYTRTCNKLFTHADGDFVAFQDADDYSLPGRLALQIKEFQNDPELTVCGTNKIDISVHNQELYCSNYTLSHEEIRQSIIDEEFDIMPNTFVFKREILETIGGYNTIFDRIGLEDYYWTWLVMENYKLINIRQPLYIYTLNPNSVTGDWSDNRMKRHAKDMLKFLITQRLKTGTDCVEQGNPAELYAYVEKLDEPYKRDPSLFYRERAIRDFYNGRQRRSLRFMYQAIKKNPLKFENYKTFFYFLRTQILKPDYRIS